MNIFVLCRFLGLIIGMVAVAMGLCFAVDCVDVQRETFNSRSGNGISCIITASAALILIIIGRRASGLEIMRREALAIVGLGWVAAAVFGSLPFLLCDKPLNVAQAFFEAMSGFTTTGSTAIANLDDYPHSILFWRALMHWIGGLGILVLFVALLAILGVSGKRSLVGNESSLNLGDSSMARLKDLASRLFMVYGALTLLCWMGLWGIGVLIHDGRVDLFETLLYAFSTVSTGGFAPQDTSVAYFDSAAVEAFLIVFMIVSSLSMLLLINLASGHSDRKVGTTEAKWFISLLAVGVILATADVWIRGHASGWQAFREVVFPVVSMGTSTGFGTSDYDQWPIFARCVLLMLMIVGGCTGSTAGGIKVVRVVISLKLLRQETIKSFRPNQVFAIKLDGRPVEADSQQRVLLYVTLTAFLILISMIVISLLEPSINDFGTLLGTVVATFFNMGPGFGAVGPTDTFADLHPATLGFLSLLMLLGRLEIFVVVALFSRTLWRRY